MTPVARMLDGRRFIAWTLSFLAWCGVSTAGAQVVRTETERVDGGTRILFTIDWRLDLASAVDSARVSALRPADLEAIGGGLVHAETVLELSSSTTPGVSLLRADEEFVALPLGEGVGMADLGTSLPSVQGVGIAARRRVGSVVAPVFRYDEATGRLARRRAVEVFVADAASKGLLAPSLDNPHLAVSRSELADGTILRIPIPAEGVYRVDRAFLTAAGLNPDTIDPDRIRVLSNGGRPLPALNRAERFADLVENAAFSRGGGDGRFDTGDALYFWAAGPSGWTWTATGWEHVVHPFSRENAVFLKIADAPGVRVASPAAPGAPIEPVLSNVVGRWFVDFEERVWSKEHGSGQDWMSNTIRSGSRRDLVQNVTPPGFTGGTVQWSSRIAIASNPRATVAFESGSQVLAQQPAPTVTSRSAEAPSASPAITNFQQTVGAGASLSLTMRLLEQINEPEAAADWVRAFYDQRLVATAGMLRFATPSASVGTMDFRVTGFTAAPQAWDVTRPDAITALGVVGDGDGWRVRVSRIAGQPPREIVVFSETGVTAAPTQGVSRVPNQDIHGTAGHPDLVIVAPAEFLEPAGELAERRRAEGLSVLLATTTQVYNEFSGGVPDMRAVRDLVKFFYDGAPDEASLPRYLLLFGDGHYDFRGLATGEGDLRNWVFPYETEESLLTDAAFTSDDYFGLLDDEEGEWIYTTFGAISTERMDIGVGRLPVQTVSEAAMVVDKIRRYETSEEFGSWRSLYTALADDGPTGLAGQQNDADLHLQNVDQVVELVRQGLYPDVNIRKIYAESYDRVFLNGFKIPDARRDVLAALNSGTLLFNYSGHGGPEGLAQEEIFTKQDAWALTNHDRLAVFVTATCSFGWWDLNEDQSGAEALLLNPNGGAVALMTTVRLVYTSGSINSLNAGLNRALNIELFTRDADGLPRRLGDVMRLTKNTTVGLQGNSRKFNLLGDPSMRIGLPPGRVRVESLNGVALEDGAGRMRALDLVTIDGRVETPAGQPDPTFDGTVSVTVYDAERRVPLERQLHMPTPYYTVREDLVWRGDVRATDGRFRARFVVPKDISYSNAAGRISAYAATGDRHALGHNEEFLVGGTSSTPPNDLAGPEVRLFVGDTTFVAGETVPASSEVIVRLFDESGINTVGAGVGHEMLLVVDADEAGAVDISSAFRSAPDSYQRGEVRWPLPDLEPGPHRLSVRAWDVLNNSATAEIDFVVADDGVLELSNVYNYPNPMHRETRFVFDHNQPPGTPATVDIRIFTLSGRPVKRIPTEEALPGGILTSGPVQVLWNGLDDDEDRLATGIYLYRVRVEAERTDGSRQRAETIERLAVIR